MRAETTPMDLLGALPDELLVSCLALLNNKSLTDIFLLSHSISARLEPYARALFQDVQAKEDSGLASELLRRQLDATGDTWSLQLAIASSQRAGRMAAVAACAWQRESEVAQGERLPAQEGHAAVVLDSRWWVVVGGYGRGIHNTVFITDTWAIERQVPLAWHAVGNVLVLPGQPTHRAKYGHACVALGRRVFAVLGGVRFGGYHGDVGDLHYVTLDDDDPSSDGHWHAPQLEVDGECHSRAYCSLTHVPADVPGAPADAASCLIAFGGIHSGAACDSLEILHLRADFAPCESHAAWATPVTSGAPPERRFGHTGACPAAARRHPSRLATPLATPRARG